MIKTIPAITSVKCCPTLVTVQSKAVKLSVKAAHVDVESLSVRYSSVPLIMKRLILYSFSRLVSFHIAHNHCMTLATLKP